MTPPLTIRIVSSAARAMAEAAEWWATNRPKAPTAFVEDLEGALKLITSHPGIGARARNVKLEDVRRVHYHLYYRLTSEPSVEVLALRHTSRGTDQEL
jgi:plasmid stabilization system protein ParE